MNDAVSGAVAPADATTEWATLGGGCFWCLDPLFSRVEGVGSVECGYANGHVLSPTYEQVCTGDTGHAEVVRIGFDPKVIDYRTLLQMFFSMHDPTTPNRQGNDVGTQYRSGIYTHGPEQERVAREVIRQLEAEHLFEAPIVTEVAPVENYARAEDEHQDYFEQHPWQGYCSFVIAPKVHKFRKQFASRLKPA